MTCWVVPSIAAEYWGISVQEVLTRLADGRLRSKQENGFTFVDVGAPRLTPEERPPTYRTIALAAEEEALDFRTARQQVQRRRPAA